MAKPKIVTPRGKIIITSSGKAQLRFNLKWKADFRDKWQARYTNGQRYVDSEVLRRSEPYIPLLSSMLIKSGILGTEIGSGLVQWIAIYSRRQYYATRAPGSATGPLRGPRWFQRMIAVHRKSILAGARRIIGKGESSVSETVTAKAEQAKARKAANKPASNDGV